MRIGCAQFSPQVGKIERNLNEADSLLLNARTDTLDLLVLPELAFTGYNHKSLAAITPFLEPAGAGVTALWARTVSLKHNCFVVAGYPEKCKNANAWSATPQHYDSAILIDPDGKTVVNYRKSFLYSTDETWSREGEHGFWDGCIDGLGNTTIGISVDINPYKDNPVWESFEFAKHIKHVGSNLVIVSMAWIGLQNKEFYTSKPLEPDVDTLIYWTSRLGPLLHSRRRDELIVVFCNRAGQEHQSTFTGTSAVLGIKDGRIKVYGVLGRGENKMLVVDTEEEPYAILDLVKGKLVAPHDGISTPAIGQVQGQRQLYDPIIRDFAHQPIHSQDPPDEEEATTPTDRTQGTPISVQTNIDTTTQPQQLEPDITPSRVRPKLIIPLSPSSMIAPVLQPISAASEASQHSLNSLLSNESTKTVQSNHRPPEESTPYPMSGMPLSGYPPNAFTGPDSILTAIGTGRGDMRAFSPPTPASSSYATSVPWAQSESSSQTPLSAVAWGAVTPKGQRSTAFPWPPVLAESDLLDDAAKNSAICPPTAVPLAITPPLEAELRALHINTESLPEFNDSASTPPATKQQNERSPHERPLSPKFHHASPFEVDKAASKPRRHPSCAPEVLKKLADISQRAMSASRARQEEARIAAAAKPRRSQSMVFTSRPDMASPEIKELKRRHSVVTKRAPSPLRTEASNHAQQLDASSQPSLRRGRKSSASSHKLVRYESPALVGPPHEQHPVRAFSRGRQPERELEEGTVLYPFNHGRRMSVDLPQTSLPAGKNKRVKSASATRGSRARQPPLADFARVEAVVHSNCPVHGVKPRTASVQNLHEVFAQQAYRSPGRREPSLRRRAPTPKGGDVLTSQSTPRRSHSKSSGGGRRPLRDLFSLRADELTPSASSRNLRRHLGETSSVNSSTKASKSSARREVVAQLQQTKFLQTKNWVISTAYESQLPSTGAATPPVPRSQAVTPPTRYSAINPKTPRALTFDIYGNLSESVRADEIPSSSSPPPSMPKSRRTMRS